MALLVLAGIFLWRGNGGSFSGSEPVAAADISGSAESAPIGHSEERQPRRTKASFRGKTIQITPHTPARFKDFILQGLIISGDLQTALDQVAAAYRETCAKTGETPPPLMFDIESSQNFC